LKNTKNNYKLLAEIFLTFLKISPITFGGGFAMIPILEMEMVEKKKWIEREKIVDIFAMSQSVPGAIAVNAASFLGYQVAGIPGTFAAVFGMIIPTFVIIILLGALFASCQHNLYVQATLRGIRPVIVALIAAAAFKMGKVAIIDKFGWAIFAVCVIALLLFKNLNLILLIFLGAVTGIVAVNVTDKIRKIRKIKNIKPEENPDQDIHGDGI
jgi:chromate transporter